MDIFDKAARAARRVGNNVASAASSVGYTLGAVTQEQSELAGLKLQRVAIDKKLEGLYAEIGRKYIAYTEKCETDIAFDVSEVMEDMKPELEKLNSINQKISELEEQIKENNLERERKKAQDQFDAEKKKLDTALSMDIITLEEYDEKITKAQKRLDNFDLIRKIDLQYEMNIISKSEHDEKIRQILEY